MSMEWRGGNHIVPVDFRDDHLPEQDPEHDQYWEWLTEQALFSVGVQSQDKVTEQIK